MTDSSYNADNSPEREVHQAVEHQRATARAGVTNLELASWVQVVKHEIREAEIRQQAQLEIMEQEHRRQEALALSATADIQLESTPTAVELSEEQETAARLQEAQAATQRALGVSTDVSSEVSDETNVIQFPSGTDQQLNTGADHDKAAA